MALTVLTLDEAGAAIRTLTVTMRSWGTLVGTAGAVALPRLAFSPAGAGAVGTAAQGDTRLTDLVSAFAMGYLEGKAGGAGDEEGGPPQGEAGPPPVRPPGTFSRFLSKPPPTTGAELWEEITTADGELVGVRRKGNRPGVHELPDDLAHAEE